MDKVINHSQGSSIVHTSEKKYPYSSIGCLETDKWILKRIAAERHMKIYDLVHELVIFAQRKPVEVPEGVKEIFAIFDRSEKK